MSRKKAKKKPRRSWRSSVAQPIHSIRDSSQEAEEGWVRLWSVFAGVFAALAILKFGTPAILAHLVDFPKTRIEWFLSPLWPTVIGYGLLAVLVLAAALLLVLFQSYRQREDGLPPLSNGQARSLVPTRNQSAPEAVPQVRAKPRSHAVRWFLFLPALWWGWQCLSAINTVHNEWTAAALFHFSSLVILFYLGYFVLGREKDLGGFRTVLLLGFLLVLWGGFSQRFGGLEASREIIFAQPDWEKHDPDFLEKIAKNRIFSTLFYPNALAGGLILLTPLCAIALWRMTAFLQVPSRVLLAGILILPAAACLYWTESKSGWLVSLVLALLFILTRRRLSNWMKTASLSLVLLGGLAGFFWKYSGYFEKGATSVAARFDYWRAAWFVAKSHPFLGAGPGTFQESYKKIKPPEAEMARLAHNDYLQQASDSGFPGAALYAGMVWWGIFQTRQDARGSPVRRAVWFGLLGFALQSFVEFGLYIPALAWIFFLLLGWAIGQDSPKSEASDGA